jgi:thiosulfate dehydrogenase
MLVVIGSSVVALAWLAGAAPPRGRAPDARRGAALLQHFNDSLPRAAGNALRCTSCHLDDGTRGTAMSWIGVTDRYPKYRARRGAVETIEQRVNECIARSLSGRMIAEDSDAMRDMVAYFASLRTLPVPPRPDTVRLAGDTLRGARGYAANCARCHAADGGGAAAPAVFGPRSYSIGAGMARQQMLATFLRWNMPHDQPGTLAPQDAADIAAYVLRRPRPDHPGKARDWPKGDAPPDVAYATTAMRTLGQPVPPSRPLLRRRVQPQPVLVP